MTSLKGRVLKAKTTNETRFTFVSERPLKYKTWNTEQLQNACKAVKEGMSTRHAAEEFQVPRSTIQDHVSGSRSGRKYLDDEEEKELVDFLLGSAKIGYPRSRKEVINLVQSLVNTRGEDVTVSSGWWQGFKSRHPKLSLRIPEQLSRPS